MMKIKIFLVKMLDKLFLKPFFSTYFKSRVESMIINNMGRNGLAVMEFKTDNNVRKVCFVFKYPFVCKIVTKYEVIENFWPGLMSRLQLVAKNQKATKKETGGKTNPKNNIEKKKGAKK